MDKLDYSKAYEDMTTLCALSLNVFIGDWIDDNEKDSPYFERMKKALATTYEISNSQNISTVLEHEAVLKELVACSELFCEAVAETNDYHKYLPFNHFLETLSK